METRKNNPDMSADLWGRETEIEVFFDGLPQDVLYAACRGLDAPLRPMAYVSDQLMVLRQTDSCRSILADVGFYSVEGILPDQVCETIRQCIRTKTDQKLPLQLRETRWELHIVPAGQGAVLVFAPAVQQQAGVTMAAARLRDCAQNLLFQAEDLDQENPEKAANTRQQAMRILRQVNHMQLLFGTPEPMRWGECQACAMVQDILQQLQERGVDAVMREPEKEITFRGDERLISAALMTLISNSLRHGGAETKLVLTVEQVGNSVSFGVLDYGLGLSDLALERMNDTWEKPDALVGGWGLGVPYARRIAAMHGGLLLFLRRKEGGTVAHLRIPLHIEDPEGMESGSDYQTFLTSGIRISDIELSDALGTDIYRTE
ncbi:sensor histidine kinase [Butyricicoccus sp.]|uniref:sensor histidine kinase n=1 Tax=Butyricicoccus sp. TaxID=2049021 RepID=UPI003F151721